MQKFRILSQIVLYFTFQVSIAQIPVIDSLENALQKNRTDRSRTEIFLALADAFMDTNNDSALFYAQKAFALATASGDKESEAAACRQTGLIFGNNDENGKALDYFQRALSLYMTVGKKDKIALTYDNLSITEYFLNHYEEAGTYANQALTLGREINDKEVIGTSLFYLGNISKRKNNFDQAIAYYQQSLEIRRAVGKKDEIASVLNNIGSFYMDRADYKNAVRYLEETLEIRRELKSPRSTGIVLTNLGNASLELGEFDKAIRYYKEATGIFREINFEPGIAADLTGMATIYETLEQYESALDVYKEILQIREKNDNPWELANTYSNISIVYSHILADTLQSIYGRDADLEIYRRGIKVDLEAAAQAVRFGLMALKERREIDDKAGISNSLANLGITYSNIGNNREALKYLTEWENLPEEFKDDKSEVIVTCGLGKIYMMSGEYDKAVSFLDRAYKKAIAMDTRIYIEKAAQYLSELYEKQGRFKDALNYYRIYNEVGDSTLQAETRKQIHEMQVKYLTEAKETENELLKKNQALTEAKLRLRNKALFASIVVLMVIVIMLVQLFRQNNLRRKANDELARKNILITGQTKEITDSIQYAGKIQNAMLPPDDLIQKLLPDHFIIYRPRDIVSGDFYWITEKDDKIIVIVSDCTGHGVPGAFMSMLGVAFLNEIVSKLNDLNASFILDELRRHVIESLHQTGREGESQDGMDITLFMIDLNTQELEFAGANNPLLIYRNSELIELKADKMPIGIHTRVNEAFSNKSFQLQKGDMVYAFSDGYPDQFGGPDGKKFMIRNFKRLLSEVNMKPVRDQKQILESTLQDWMSNTSQIDDILVMGVRI